MRYLKLIFVTIVAFYSFHYATFAQGKKSGLAKITFIAKEGDNAKTYVGKLKKGDISNLKYELQRFNSGSKNEVDADDSKGSVDGYVNRIAVVGQKNKNKKKLESAARKDLIGNFEVKDQEELTAVKEKKHKADSLRFLSKDETGNYLKYNSSLKRNNKSQLSKYYHVSGRRIRNGQTITKHAGGVALIVTYKLREGRDINTYVNVVEEYLKPGSKYHLRYHGSGSKRLYYLEFVSAAKTGK
jgi:hypothetical protein